MGGGIRFLDSSVGARIAYTTTGSGPPLVLVTPWVSHLELSQELSGARPFVEHLARHHTVVRYDRWGTGLSDRNRSDFSVDADVTVLLDVAAHLGLRRFALFGPSHGGPTAVAGVLTAPRQVSHLILYATRATALVDNETWGAMRDLMHADWEMSRRAMAAVALAGASADDIEAFAQMSLAAADRDTAIRLQDAAMAHDFTEQLERLRVPTLVVQRRDDPFVSVDDARCLAGRIPGATLELLDGAAHVHVVGNSTDLAERITAFTAGSSRRPRAQLTEREAEVLDLIAAGHTNAEAAERLSLSVRTVERHLLNAYRKLGARGRTDATAHWLRTEPARR